MSGKVICKPEPPEPAHQCNPAGWLRAHDHPPGTIWQCDACGRTWVSVPSRRRHSPFAAFRREGRFERRRRERRGGS